MKKIEEHLEVTVSLETAKIIKELGFDLVVRQWWELFGSNNLFEPISAANYNDTKVFEGVASAPTQTQLRDWLVENYNMYIEISIDRTAEPKFLYKIFKYTDFGNWKEKTIKKEFFLETSFENALESAFIETLNLIKNQNNE